MPSDEAAINDGSLTPGPAGPVDSRLHQALKAPWHGVLLCGPMFSEVVVAVTLVVTVALMAVGVGLFLLPGRLLAIRSEARRSRHSAGRWTGTEITEHYHPAPTDGVGTKSLRSTYRWLLSDPTTWRDLWWLVANPTVGWLLTLLPAALVAWGFFGLVMPAVWKPIVDAHANNWYAMIHVTSAATAWICVPLGLAFIVAGLAIGPAVLRGYGRFAQALLAPSPRAELTQRVAHLTETRTQVVDHQAEEIKRIERDLHDGAQARLVAMGMTLGAAEQLIETDPVAAKTLVTGAREASAKALSELRDLVRGIHPPVLADRGLGDALRALALDSPLEVSVDVHFDERLPAPLESAVYFAITELLTNAAKHAFASQVTIDIQRDDQVLQVVVSDNGIGDVDRSKGSGIVGIEQRLTAFDGSIEVESPPGGPTTVTMEIPCAS